MRERVPNQPADFLVACHDHSEVLDEAYLVLVRVPLVLSDAERARLDAGVDSKDARKHDSLKHWLFAMFELRSVHALAHFVSVVEVEVASVEDLAKRCLHDDGRAPRLELIQRVDDDASRQSQLWAVHYLNDTSDFFVLVVIYNVPERCDNIEQWRHKLGELFQERVKGHD